MTQEHPITPPPELVQQWYNECPEANEASLPYVAIQAARWGADQELEACCEWAAEQDRGFDDELRATRRPKPPSLKEQALEALAQVHHAIEQPIAITIRRALEALPE